MKKLDLHGVKHQNVSREIDKFIWKCMQANDSEAEIIIGNSSLMDKIVKECIADYHGLKVMDNFLSKSIIRIKL